MRLSCLRRSLPTPVSRHRDAKEHRNNLWGQNSILPEQESKHFSDSEHQGCFAIFCPWLAILCEDQDGWSFQRCWVSSSCRLRSHLHLLTNRVRQLRQCSSTDLHSWSYSMASTFWGCNSCPFHLTQKIQSVALASQVTSCWLPTVQPAEQTLLAFELHILICKLSILEMPSLTFHLFSGWKLHSWRSTNSHWCCRARL